MAENRKSVLGDVETGWGGACPPGTLTRVLVLILGGPASILPEARYQQRHAKRSVCPDKTAGRIGERFGRFFLRGQR